MPNVVNDTIPLAPLPPEALSNQDSVQDWLPSIDMNQALVMDLTEIYFEVIYPVFPLFHRPTLTRRVSRGEYLKDRSLFASTAAMCALASARARDGAVYSASWDLDSLREPASEQLLAAAIEALPRDAPMTQDLGYMRAYLLISISYIQYGRMTESQYYLNGYHSFVAVGSLHDEREWPARLSTIEKEERRRLFWSAYTLDVFTSIIGKGVVRGSEAAFNVSYPSEVNDEVLAQTNQNTTRQGNGPEQVSWLKGWNFVTDLYRILEHALYSLRRLRSREQRTPTMPITFFDCPISQNAVLDHVMAMYNDLPAILKSTKPVGHDFAENLLSFQAANIAATIQLVRMVLFTTEGSNVEQKCQIGSELVGAFASVPTAYLRAISSPLLHHLTGIGIILGSAFNDGLTQSSYMRIRSVLLELTELISHLEEGLYYSAGTSEKLRAQVTAIDDFWRTYTTLEMTGTSIAVDPPRASVENHIVAVPGAADERPTLNTNGSPHFHFPSELLDNWSWVFDSS